MTCPDMIAFYRASDLMILCAHIREMTRRIKAVHPTVREAERAFRDFGAVYRKLRERKETP